jgi:hypothetical protein
MKYTNISQVSKYLTNVPEDYIIRSMIHRMMNDIPLEELKKLFEITILDPDDKEFWNIVFQNDDKYTLDKLRELRDINCSEYKAVIDIGVGDSYDNLIGMLKRMKTFGDRITEDYRNQRINTAIEIIEQLKDISNIQQ